ncbi:MAG: hypothetical protein ACI93V_001363 [Alteromonadaceae bacterium]|jgi:hypothetical protein
MTDNFLVFLMSVMASKSLIFSSLSKLMAGVISAFANSIA